MPLRVCASMFLMPLTLVLIEYWLYVVTRCSISGTLRPVYCQITDTTGMLISGKMSSGMTTMAEMPSNRMETARTYNVYGNFSANRTIPISISSSLARNDLFRLRLDVAQRAPAIALGRFDISLAAFSEQLVAHVFFHLLQTARHRAKNAGIDAFCRDKEELGSQRLDVAHQRRGNRRQS